MLDHKYKNTIAQLEKMAADHLPNEQGRVAVEAAAAIVALQDENAALVEHVKMSCAYAVSKCVRQDPPALLINVREAREACINAKL